MKMWLMFSIADLWGLWRTLPRHDKEGNRIGDFCDNFSEAELRACGFTRKLPTGKKLLRVEVTIK